jgi:hypothetical protein
LKFEIVWWFTVREIHFILTDGGKSAGQLENH